MRVRVGELEYDGAGGSLFRLLVEGKPVSASAGRGRVAFLPRRRILEAVEDARRMKRPPNTVYSTEQGGGDPPR